MHTHTHTQSNHAKPCKTLHHLAKSFQVMHEIDRVCLRERESKNEANKEEYNEKCINKVER